MPTSAFHSHRLLDRGTAPFVVEARLVRELGERLVKEPEIALLELIKNSYDADAMTCGLRAREGEELLVEDDGNGMTQQEFLSSWMRIGTSGKEKVAFSRKYGRAVSGEKGIGRFAVRYLGRHLVLESVAWDSSRKCKTRVVATFDWPKFDRYEDLGRVEVPFDVYEEPNDTPTGLRLSITKLRKNASSLDLRRIRTAAIGLVSPYTAFIKEAEKDEVKPRLGHEADPGFSLFIHGEAEQTADLDVAASVLNNAVIRVRIRLRDTRLSVKLWRRDEERPRYEIVEKIDNTIGPVDADLRFYPKRKGTFTDLPVNGKRAESWVRENSGIAVFDGRFRVFPYGRQGDDWLALSADKARNQREPTSSLIKKHFPMSKEVRLDPTQNYMLQLPYPIQLVGAVRVRSTRDSGGSDEVGLIPAADREGFIHNDTFTELQDVIRAGVELIAVADRELLEFLAEEESAQRLAKLKAETREIVTEIEGNAALRREDKQKLIRRVEALGEAAANEAEYAQKREQALEVMSLLGVVAGFMTHEFGVAVDHLEKSKTILDKLSRRHAELKPDAEAVSSSIANLRDFVTYSEGYIRGASSTPDKPFPAAPRIAQMIRVFGKYAEERGIAVESSVESSTTAPAVPLSLYNGVVLNLYTNALKAVTGKSGRGERRIAFRAWNENGEHYLEVSDTGVGIPTALRKRVFDPLFTTTEKNRDPLGSGMGLGLTLVKRGVEAYAGQVTVIDPPPGFSTCFQVRLPLE
ncbi:ATP-binding protein [Acidovorax sp. Root267]|uniref:sensor histidine kinase n=1 Tax=Acidovorax sp. Root267 TaxID=1736505 RepID=UPI0009E6C411|nr:ATP-binding protein [Acidovorax sp. Root267]